MGGSIVCTVAFRLSYDNKKAAEKEIEIFSNPRELDLNATPLQSEFFHMYMYRVSEEDLYNLGSANESSKPPLKFFTREKDEYVTLHFPFSPLTIFRRPR